MVKATSAPRNPTSSAPSTPSGKATTSKSSPRKRKTPAIVSVSSSDDDEEVKTEIKDEKDDDVKPPVSKRPKREAAPTDMKEKGDDEGAFVHTRLCDIPLWPGNVPTGGGGMSSDDDDDAVQFLGVYSRSSGGGADFYVQRRMTSLFKEEQPF